MYFRVSFTNMLLFILVSFSLFCLVSATLPLIFFKEKRREIWADICKKTVRVERMTVDPAIVCLYLPEKRHRCLRIKYELQAVFGSEEFKKILFEKTNLNSFLSQRKSKAVLI